MISSVTHDSSTSMRQACRVAGSAAPEVNGQQMSDSHVRGPSPTSATTKSRPAGAVTAETEIVPDLMTGGEASAAVTGIAEVEEMIDEAEVGAAVGRVGDPVATAGSDRSAFQ